MKQQKEENLNMKYFKSKIVFLFFITALLFSSCAKKDETAPAISKSEEEIETTEPEEASKSDSKPIEETEIEPEPEEEIVDNEISENWMDGEFLLDGVKLKMPCSYKEMAKTGWLIDRSSEYKYAFVDENFEIDEENSIKEDYIVPAGGYFTATFLLNEAYENDRILVDLYNPTDKELDVEDCTIITIYRFSDLNVAFYGEDALSQMADVILSKGITYGATKNEVIEAFGEPTDSYESSAGTSMTYINEETSLRMELGFGNDFGLDSIGFFWDDL